MPMHQIPFPYFYHSNGSKTHQFSPSPHQTSNNDIKSNRKRLTITPETSLSPINFSSRLQNVCDDDANQVDAVQSKRFYRSRSMSNDEKNSNEMMDDENVEVD